MGNIPAPTKKNIIHSKRSTQDERMRIEEIKAFMKKHSMSEKAFCEMLGVTPQALTLWLTGKREFSVTNSRLLRLMDKRPILIGEF